jgi:hypothetical protein
VVEGARICTGAGIDEICMGPNADLAARGLAVVAAERHQVAEVSATVVSETDEQVGPARIVSFSRDTEFRNLTLAQRGTTLLLRIRTSLAGGNGGLVVYELPEAVFAGEETRVRGSFNRGAVSLEAETPDRTSTTTYSQGLLTGWWILRTSDMSPAIIEVAAFAGAIALTLPIGLAAGVALQAASLATVTAISMAVLLIASLQFLLGAAVDVRHLAYAAACSGLGVALSRWGSARQRPS